MPNNVLLLETVLMNSFVGEDSWVYVKVGDSYIRKKGRDLQVGDLVVVNNEGIHKELKDVEPALERSMRYLVAKRTLHEANRNGQDIKKFRILLLRGLADPSTSNLEQRIMLEGDDFSTADYPSFNDRAMQYVFGVEENAVREWLKGNTLAPRDWRNFARLAPINKEFEAINQSFGQTTGYYAAYQLFTGLRRTIMAYIAKRTGVINESDTGTETPDYPHVSGKYAKEIELVVGHFMQEVDRTRSATRITRIKPVEITKEEGKSREKPDPNLKRGVFVGELDLPLMDMNQIRQELYILDNALYDSLNNYSLHKLMREEPITPETVFLLPTLSIYLFTRLVTSSSVDKRVFENNLEAMLKYGKSRSAVIQRLNDYHSMFLREIQEGEIDRVLGVEDNTIAHLVDLVNQYRSAMPRAYFERRILDVDIKLATAELVQQREPRNVRREKEREGERLIQRFRAIEKYLLDTYSLRPNPKNFFLSYLNDNTVHEGTQVKDLTDAELRTVKRQFELQGARFYTREETLSVLTRLGIPDAIRLYDTKTFI